MLKFQFFFSEFQPTTMDKMRGQYAGRCVYYRLPELKEDTQAYRRGDH